MVAQARALGGDYADLGISPSAATGGVALAMVVRTRFYSAKGQLLRCCWMLIADVFCGDGLGMRVCCVLKSPSWLSCHTCVEMLQLLLLQVYPLPTGQQRKLCQRQLEVYRSHAGRFWRRTTPLSAMSALAWQMISLQANRLSLQGHAVKWHRLAAARTANVCLPTICSQVCGVWPLTHAILLLQVACIGIFIWAAVVLASVGAQPTRIVVRFFDMITIAVPPALPACLTIATVFSIGRLRKIGIYVTGPHTITLAGQLDVVCFDKTGTLTVQGLELQSIVPVNNGRFEPSSTDMQQLPPDIPRLLASCHGLAWLGDTLVGDPLDQKLFAASGWTLQDKQQQNGGMAAPPAGGSGQQLALVHPPGRPDAGASVVRRFEFSSQLQRNLVVVKLPGSAGASTTTPAEDGGHALAAADAAGITEDLLGAAVPSLGSVHHSASSPALAGVAAATTATHVLYVKGSPELIKTLVQGSSVPPDFDRVLSEYTREGLRVLALARGVVAAGSLPEGAVKQYSQQQLEAAVPLELVGLAVLANPLRPDTSGAIQALQKAQIRTAMVTGDHVRTAVSVAHLCNILPVGRPVLLMDAAPAGTIGSSPLALSVLYPDGSVNHTVSRAAVLPQVMMGELECAVTGKGFDALLIPPYDQELLQPMLRRGSVFARMSPDNKRDLTELLGSGLQGAGPGCPKLGLHVGFCGDGANDCGALKAAHVGVSLCEAEASVAAPMTSKQQSITSMISVVAEGRCALLATYQIFQFIVGYAMAQAFATNLMYTHALQMGNYQYLIQDLFYITILAALMGYTEPRKALARSKPVGRVLSLPLILSLCLQIAVVIVFQLVALGALHRIPWYTPTVGSPDLRTYIAPETTVIYLINLAQFIILGAVFNKGYPHRQPLWTNWGLLVAMILQVLFLIYSLFSVDPFTIKVQQLVGKDPPKGLPDAFRAGLLAIMAVNAAAAVLAEVLSTYSLRLIAKGQTSSWWRRRKGAADPAMRQGLLGPVLLGSTMSGQISGKGSAPGSLPVHLPTLQPPSGAALL
eukprot:GHUV01030743.1.p1 GENE.GHUV01030743.1~~GHUV01030743.1.p1  ORF type:complete len:1032 (+),score=296.88 GHUV01030743.1:1466-4561(+)